MTMQQKVHTFAQTADIHTDVSTRMLDLISEVGELSKEVIKSTQYGEIPFQVTDAFVDEYGDVLFAMLMLANQTGIDVEQCIDQTLDKYRSRMSKTQQIGSQT